MRIYPLFCLLVSVFFLYSCTSPSPSQQANSPQKTSSQQVVNVDENFKRVAGQTVYVPVYSHIYHDDGKKTFNLAATLSIRNTDLANPIVITFVRYYDTNGKLVRQYLEQPIQIDALASTDFVIDTTDTSGGSGAKFLVEWIAQTEISEPIIEAVMIGSGYHQGISFISPGKVIKSDNNK
ncbi:DUF3124 domain-containing protein [Chroococcidiopsis thermalis]|jgi:hypothetical protein|uniref:DUF3124 domain-containing protein n=1 Tax=Chroococcidiopsis thermalis (strain PCC 7203) TaxID=251229 RepID=K9TUU7_CHRTP|nr:DUF3124 domain-containing protein [Chroococcidiopsis thermalis]AFY86315.1 hypothetical protein Chro_0769 [Chroococcidiopsis thermalis PCC 7203]PSB43704.1 DUF3124 domain-containing protein [Cyanosarcina cf. burmensis CCALA 770]